MATALLESLSEPRLLWLFGAALLASLLLWLVPKWQVRRLKPLQPKELFEQENEARKTLSQIIGGVVVLVGLYYTSENINIAQRTAKDAQNASTESRELTREGQITDRFTRAIAQLGETGSGKTSVRLGGIYALERISRESEADHLPIMSILASYVQEHAPQNFDKSGSEFRPGIDAPLDEIQAIMTVVAHRTEDRIRYERRFDFYLDLAGTNLRRVKLEKARLERANLNACQLQAAHLDGANFTEANLLNTYFQGAFLDNAVFDRAFLHGTYFNDWDDAFARQEGIARQETTLEGASFKGANLTFAHISGANLQRANLDGADVERVDFTGVDLRGANLRGVMHMTQEQLNSACVDIATQLPAPVADGSSPLSFEAWKKGHNKKNWCE
jgi:hypothetical protein